LLYSPSSVSRPSLAGISPATFYIFDLGKCLHCPKTLPAMGRKEASLPFSTVFAFVAALLLGHLLLPTEPPSPSAWLSQEALWAVDDEPPLPTVDAGRALERQQSPSYLQVPVRLGNHALSADAMAEQEVHTLWEEGILRCPVQAKGQVFGSASPLLLIALPSAGILGLAASLADVQDALAEEVQKARGEARTTVAQEPPNIRLHLLLCAVLAIVAVVSNSAGPSASSVKPIAAFGEVELNKLIALQSPGAGSLCDGLVATALVLWVLLGLCAALTDMREMALEEPREANFKLPARKATGNLPASSAITVPLALQKAFRYVAAIAAVAAVVLAASVCIEGRHLPFVAGSDVLPFRWAFSDEATAAALTVASLLGAAVSRVDLREEVECQSRKLQAQAK